MSCSDQAGSFIATCKKEFIAIVDDNDELPISNLGALRMGLEALQKEDSSDTARANELWAAGRRLLAEESQDDEGAGAQGSVQVADDLDMASVGGICTGGYWP